MKTTKIDKARLEGKIIMYLNNDKLLVVNNCMSGLDQLQINSVPKAQKSIVSICFELRTELLQKAVKTRLNDKHFAFKMSFHKAEALQKFLTDYEIYFPDSFGIYENNLIRQIKTELHQQLL